MLKEDLSGKIFGKITVKSYAGIINHRTSWNCVCECGTYMIRSGSSLLRSGPNKHCKSCGIKAITHGSSRKGLLTIEYKTWLRMRRRCLDPKHENYHNYGGAGVKICSQWNDFTCFLKDVGKRPSAKHSLDRYPNQKGDYEPGNVRWATATQQANNRKSNHYIFYKGENITISQAAKKYNISKGCLRNRIVKHGWTPARAIETPVTNNKTRGLIVWT